MESIKRSVNALTSSYIEPICYIQATNVIPIEITFSDVTLTNGSTAMAIVRNSDGTKWEQEKCAINVNTITVQPTIETFSCAGTAQLQIEVSDDSSYLYTKTIPVIVGENLFAIDLNDESNQTVLSKALDDMKASVNAYIATFLEGYQEKIEDLDEIREANQFWATYGETTYDEIVEAYNNGCAIFCNYGSRQFQLVYISASAATFLSFSSITTHVYLQARSTGTWTSGSRSMQEALTAGENITISSDGTISAEGTTASIADGAVTEAKLATDVIEELNEADKKLNIPVDEDGAFDYGTAGQILASTGDGINQWADIAETPDQIVGEYVTNTTTASEWTALRSLTLPEAGTYFVFFTLTLNLESTGGNWTIAIRNGSDRARRQSVRDPADSHYYSASIGTYITVTEATEIVGEMWSSIAHTAYICSFYAYKTANAVTIGGSIPKSAFINSVAHRGYSDVAPENTLSAFKMARKLGFEYVETDVQFTSDNVPVLLHDSTIDRTSNGSGAIASMTLAKAQTYDFGSWKSSTYAGETIPTLESFLILCKRIGLKPYIELKSDVTFTTAQIKAVVDMVEKYNLLGETTFISFNGTYLQTIHSYKSDVRLGYLLETVTSDTVSGAASMNAFVDWKYDSSSASSACTLCSNSDVPLEVWTVDDEDTIKSMDAYISGVTSNSLKAGEIVFSAYI